MTTEYHNTTSRYYPVTKKDHGREFKEHQYYEGQDYGMGTHHSSSRYVPAKNGFIFAWLHGGKGRKNQEEREETGQEHHDVEQEQEHEKETPNEDSD